MKEELKKNLLIVNSYDRKDGDSNNFNYSLGDTSIDIEGISLKSATIPHTYTNVNSSNNILKYSKGTEIVLAHPYEGSIVINGFFKSYTFLGGIYTQQEFIEAFNNSSAGVGIVKLSYNSVAGRYELETISNVNSLEITQPIYNPSYRNLWNYLGFLSPTQLGVSVGDITQAPNPAQAPFDVNGIEYFEVSITEGQYDITTLMPEIATALSTNITGSISITINTVVQPIGYVVISGATETWKFEECELATMLGYIPKDMEYTISPQVAQGVPNMYGTHCLFVNSKTLMNGYNALQVGEKSSIISNIPVCSVYQGIDKYEAKYPIWKMYPQPININEFDIFITDDRGKIIDLKNANICLVFEILTTTRL